MTKGRTLTISRSERFLGSYGHRSNTHDAEEEFGEDDVWSMVDNMVNGDHYSVSNDWRSRRRHAVVQPPASAGGLTVAFEDQPMKKMVTSQRIIHQFRRNSGHQLATSAPVNVPDWSKIYRVDSGESMPDSDDGTDDLDGDMVPPHEYLARSHKSSVFEGVGRTLKGRDLSRVRDAVWSQTGFDG